MQDLKWSFQIVVPTCKWYQNMIIVSLLWDTSASRDLKAIKNESNIGEFQWIVKKNIFSRLLDLKKKREVDEFTNGRRKTIVREMSKRRYLQ